MPRFEPFAGLRYQMSANLDPVTAPPYDVIDEPERAELAGRSPYNAVRLELPVDEDAEEGEDRYQGAARLLRRWSEIGMVVPDDPASFYLYRMGYHDPAGRSRQTTGVIGALGLEALGEGDVLPHEHTTTRAKSDRRQLLEATKTNVSPIWCLSLARGLAAMVEPLGPPFARCTDDDGVHHRLWRVNSPAIVDTITEVVESAPVIIADGHHRYETALAYRDSLGGTASSGTGAHDLIMALVVELADDEIFVQPIHRLLTGLPDDLDVVDALSKWFRPEEVADPAASSTEATLAETMAQADALGLVLPDGHRWLLHPRAEASPGDLLDLDSSRADLARADLPTHEVAYRHDAADVESRVRGTSGSAGLLLRPAGVDQIADAARQRVRMPPKTTFFYPKPRTGMVFRSIDR